VKPRAPVPIVFVMHLLPWLTDHVRRTADTCGAIGASVYVPTPWSPSTPGILVHSGHAPTLPEMATLEDACAFASRAAARLGAPQDAGTTTTIVIPGSIPEACFIPIPVLATLWHRASMSGVNGGDPAVPRRRLSDRVGGPPIVGWLGLRFTEPSNRALQTGGWQSLIDLASALASTYVCCHGILTDPITGLPGRAELHGTLRAEIDRAVTHGLPFSLMFVKIQNLDGVNERLGRRVGDAVLRDFLDVLQGVIRGSDAVMLYGGAVFALPIRDMAASGALALGERIRQSIGERGFFDGTLALSCAVGVASCEGPEGESLQALDLLRRADQALSAALEEGGRQVVLWRADGNMTEGAHIDPLLGVFTGQAEKDYRNMRLLWEVLRALSSATGDELAEAVVGRMVSLFAATRAALFESTAGRGLRLTAGRQRLAESEEVSVLTSDDIEPDEWRMNEEVCASLAPQHRRFRARGAAEGAAPRAAVAVPLVIDGRALGTLYLAGGAEAFEIDQTDVPFLGGVAAQLALARDREQLADQQRLREHHEHLRLRSELDRLRTVLKQSQFVFRSKPMEDLLSTARRVALTDATVLITGESGTGKELLAHTLHELGGRRDKSLVIVDCGAIPVSLMDSELFGREKGAYTGAERRTGGRLVQAHGGTVFLDEIGELPLEVQAKLLRFVQEKTITMVGATDAQKVDVRIVAATNRALEDEVRAGRFREDLFHRLNVVRLRIPPLRERPDDVLYLATHFLETFSRQHARVVRGFDAEAERLLEAYDWPGNVRELQNTILQAVVLGEGEVVRASHLQLRGGDGGPRRSEFARHVTSSAEASPTTVAASPGGRAPRAEGSVRPYDEARQILVARLKEEVTSATASGAKLGPPLGKWLARDLVIEAYALAGSVATRAAARLGIPETTFSRHLRQAEAEAATTRRPESWEAVRSGLADLLRATGRPSGNLMDDLDELLLDLVVADAPGGVTQAAGLMGLSVPTMKRRMSRLRPDGHAVAGCV
jgi:hydrogenase-4 transcriptional activator